MEMPMLIYEFEGGPSMLYWDNPLLHGPGYDSDKMKPAVFEILKSNPIFKELHITPVINAIQYTTEELVMECEDCEDCNEETCPQEGEYKGSAMKVSEVLTGWFLYLDNCPRLHVCPHCNGEGYVKAVV